jgi:mono/diheme cytochrome c family protein
MSPIESVNPLAQKARDKPNAIELVSGTPCPPRCPTRTPFSAVVAAAPEKKRPGGAVVDRRAASWRNRRPAKRKPLALAASPVLAADATNGKRVAMRWCAACHVVAPDQRHAYADAPPFKEIASRPNFSESGLVTFLLNPHAKMPNMSLTRVEANDVAAYIRTLR